MSETWPKNVAPALELARACLLANVDFHCSAGVLMIHSSGLMAALSHLSGQPRVLGFDSFTLNGNEVHPRLDYYTDFGEGISIDAALDAVVDWPDDLWIEVVLGDH